MPSPFALSVVWPWLLIAFGIGYVFGSIPFGLLFTRLGGAGDIRAIGSGNIGATNVLRTGRKGIAAATLVADAAKGAAAVLLVAAVVAYPLGSVAFFPPSLAAGLGAVVGHCFPVWLNFKGGKGVATTLGCLLAWSWPLGLAACLLWLALAAAFRISSLSALLGLALTAALTWVLAFTLPFGRTYATVPLAITVTLVVALVLATHHENIRRLLAGTEPRIGATKSG